MQPARMFLIDPLLPLICSIIEVTFVINFWRDGCEEGIHCILSFASNGFGGW
jgi:hypothetical protein